MRFITTTRRALARRALASLALVAMVVTFAPPPGGAQSTDSPRPCTAIVTPMISTLRFASDLGLATGPALVPGLVGTGLALPGNAELAGQIQSLLNDTVYPQVFDGAAELKAMASDLLDLLDDVLTFLASANAAIDQGIEQMASTLDQIAETYGDQIAPANRTLTDLAAASRYFASGTCGG